MAGATATASSKRGIIPVILLVVLSAVIIYLLISHWKFTYSQTLTATPTSKDVTPVQKPEVPAVVTQEPTPAQPVVLEKPLYVNLLIVDPETEIPQFVTIRGVLDSSVKPGPGGSTEFTYQGKQNYTFALVIKSVPYADSRIDPAPYVDSENEIVGTISCPGVPGKMNVVRSNQSLRDVFFVDGHMRYITGSGEKIAPPNSGFYTFPFSPN